MAQSAQSRYAGGSGQGRFRRAWLRLRVHIDAVTSQPALYFQGVGWRVRGLKLRARHRFSGLMGHSPRAYALWMATREPVLLAQVPKAGSAPSIKIVIDVRAGKSGLSDTLASIAQLHGERPQVALLGGNGTGDEAIGLPDLPALAQWLSELGGNPWIMAICCGDRIAPLAIETYRKHIVRKGGATLVYADDDLIDGSGIRHDPHFKPDWNPELYRHHDFLTGSCVFAWQSGAIGPDWPRAAFDMSAPPVHLPLVLHHRRDRPVPIVPTPSAADDEGDLPHVSVIIPTRNHVGLLRTCITGLQATRYPAFDITVVDNDSDDPATIAYLDELRGQNVTVMAFPGAFNYAALHNAIVPTLAGPLICLLNNDIEIIDPDWLRIMVRAAMRDDVGAVGARLLYPDRTMQHAGIVIGVGGGAGHAHRLQHDGDPGYHRRAHLPQFISAVTAACIVLRKDRFEAVGGFDAENFKVAFNDVDLCLKLNAKGWQSFYEARACLIHHESKSRGLDDSADKKARFAGELAALKRKWATDQIHDPYHHPELSQYGEQFVVRL